MPQQQVFPKYVTFWNNDEFMPIHWDNVLTNLIVASCQKADSTNSVHPAIEQELKDLNIIAVNKYQSCTGIMRKILGFFAHFCLLTTTCKFLVTVYCYFSLDFSITILLVYEQTLCRHPFSSWLHLKIIWQTLSYSELA